MATKGAPSGSNPPIQVYPFCMASCLFQCLLCWKNLQHLARVKGGLHYQLLTDFCFSMASQSQSPKGQSYIPTSVKTFRYLNNSKCQSCVTFQTVDIAHTFTLLSLLNNILAGYWFTFSQYLEYIIPRSSGFIE